MRGRTATALLFIMFALAALPAAAQPQFTVVGAALIELIDIGKASGTIGHSGDAILKIGDATDDEVRIESGSSDAISLWVNQNLLSATFRPSGIVDLGMQSRARWSLATTQVVPQATWTPIEFDFDPTLADPDHFDSQGESVPGAPPHQIVETWLEANNAPNVSDVVFLLAGEAIQIHAWWDAGLSGTGAVADLVAGKHKTYVSVHKLS